MFKAMVAAGAGAVVSYAQDKHAQDALMTGVMCGGATYVGDMIMLKMSEPTAEDKLVSSNSKSTANMYAFKQAAAAGALCAGASLAIPQVGHYMHGPVQAAAKGAAGSLAGSWASGQFSGGQSVCDNYFTTTTPKATT